MLNKKSLIARWNNDQLNEVNRLLAAVTGKPNLHQKDRSFPSSPYGQNEAGLEDYRGVTLTETKLDSRYVTHTFSHCSFRGAKLNNARISKEFTNCDFTGCNLSKVIANDVSFTRCRFANANFRGALLLYCRFEECSFDGAFFQDGSVAGSRFTGEAGLLPVWGNSIMDNVKIYE
jgi:fluoroquinolone resistance protein